MFVVLKYDWDNDLRERLEDAEIEVTCISRGDDPTLLNDFVGWLYDKLSPVPSILSGHVYFETSNLLEARETMNKAGCWYFDVVAQEIHNGFLGLL